MANANARVVNVRVAELRRAGYPSLAAWLAADAHHVYIGRSMAHYVPGAVASKWANPYSVETYGRESALARYRAHIERSPALAGALDELRGATLGCWCAPERCHGDVLVEMLAERDAAARGERARPDAQSSAVAAPSLGL
jgi:hypothetical protein